MPEVSVITSVYNGEAYLDECVQSILNQTFQEFEFIMLNNGSTDRTPEILEQYTDSRIRVIHQENLGIPRSLNKGIELSRSDLIARLDADDFSSPHRLERQVHYMKQNPGTVLCGSRFQRLLGKDSFPQKIPFVENDRAIRKIISCFNPFAHSTVIFRKNAFLKIGGYNNRFKFSQDYELWVRMLQLGEARVLKDVLTVIRETKQSISNQNSTMLNLEGLRVRWNALCQFGGDPAKILYYFLKSVAGLIFPFQDRFRR
ncbi:MAG: glycosyltransferase [Nitrospinae bacterium]|nr:glycosyltransferase [Nitrospinota bacterium]